MMARSISVIVPTWNSARYLPAALDSVFAQSFPPSEVIVVDDGSTDDTEAVAAPYRDRIAYIKLDHAGPASARNEGTARAKGELIAFLDADDTWLPEKLEKQNRVFDEHPETALVYTRIVNFAQESGQELRIEPARVYSGLIFDELLVENPIALPSVVVRSEVLQSVGGFDRRLLTAEDTNLYLKIAREHRIVGLDEVLVRRRMHRGNLSSRVDCRIGTLDNLDLIVSRFPETNPSRYPRMKAAYRVKGTAMLKDLFHGGNYRGCHLVCVKLLLLGICRIPIVGYWLVTFLPDGLVHRARSLRHALR
jgi:glycosyltransferase involved in cell wall biosynthesis